MTALVKAAICRAGVALLNAQRRVDPYFRDAFDRVFRRRLSALVQSRINSRRPNLGLRLAEERTRPGEEEATRAIIDAMSRFTRQQYAGRTAERAGNTKTYGVVRGEFEVLPELVPDLRHGVLAEPRTYRAWVRLAGPGPATPPDIEDNGILSIGVKLLGVPGPKLLDDERMTQDFTGISAPTFTTPDVFENAKLQRELAAGTPLWYFVNPRDSHLLDGIMQALYARAQANPLEVQYWSCVPYLLGPGQAMKYAFRPLAPPRSRVPRHPEADYLRKAMAARLSAEPVEFAFLVQLQTDPHLMPIEDASVEWPERLSPFVPAATLRLPRQDFDSPEQLAFAHRLSFNPWHCVADHRPLGNQNRARRVIYQKLSLLRQSMNGTPHVEPTGDETFLVAR